MENSEISVLLFNKNILSEENVIRCPKCYLIFQLIIQMNK